MFDISFSELMVIAVVALLVIGPEKLPKVARTAGLFMGKLQRYMSQVKEEINREVRFEELQKLQTEIASGAQSLKQGLQIDQYEFADSSPYNNVEDSSANSPNSNVTKRKLKKTAYIKRNNFSKISPKQTLKNHQQKKGLASGK